MCILLIQSEKKVVEQQMAAEETILSEDSDGPHSDHEEECAELDEGDNGTEYEDETGTTTETETETEEEIENSNR